MNEKKYWTRNQDKRTCRNHLLFLWSSFSYCTKYNDIEGCNRYLELLENQLPFESEEEHQKWVEISSSFKFWEDFEDFTKSIIFRILQEEKDDLILAYEEVAKDLCLTSDFEKVFDAFERLTHYVYKIKDFSKYWKTLCKNEWELQNFLENYKAQFGDYLNIEEVKQNSTYYGLEDTPSCMFFKNDLEGKYDLMECIFERYAMGLEDDECLTFFKELIKRLTK